jgi:AraC family transcriptional regulator of adaptative response/methylated-DNA-[protein]-cysteine methyltransferase
MIDTERWPLIVHRDREASFFYAVVSTGVYCRPSCPSRRPNPRNVRFFDTSVEAEAAGFRACKRCQPADRLEPRTSLVRDICRFLEANADRRISLAELSEFASLSPFHLQRQFRAELGVTPREYQAALRSRQEPEPNEVITWGFFESPPGAGLVATSTRGVCAVSFGRDQHALVTWLKNEFPYAQLQPGVVTEAAAEVLHTIDTGHSTVPLDIRGTAFQHKVWNALRAIPPGETRSYEQLAAAAGNSSAVRAAGTACGANRIAVLIPCHRALRKDGGLGGYRWGLEIKRHLLRQERE